MDFGANLAFDLEDRDLDKLAMDLFDEIESDKQARSDWDNGINLAFKYLGFRIEEGRSEPFINACAAFDGTLARALISTYSVFRAELFPASGPVAGKTVGTATKEKQENAERVEIFANNYLTKIDRGYYPDSEQLIIYNIFCGSAFRKVYPDPKDGKPTARMVKPQDFIVNPDTVDLMSASRMTHVVPYTRKEVIRFEEIKYFKEGTLPLKDADFADEGMSKINKTIEKIDGVNKSTGDKKMVVSYYECHVELDPNEVERGRFKPEDDGKEEYRPYIVTFCPENKKVASIRRGWEENDPNFQKVVYFVNYYYIKGFGIYGMGLAHLMGSSAIVLTSVLRQLIDAGSLKNFPAFLYAKGTRLENNDFALGPAEGKEVELAGLGRIQDLIMPLPYNEPSMALMQLRKEMIDASAGVGASAQTEVPESGINAPVGTTLALLEVANRVMATTLRSFHFALGYEFELLYKLFGKYLPEQPYPFMVPGKDTAIMRADFNDFVNITPVSEPNMLMRSQRMIQSEALMQLAEKHPEIHNIREVYLRVYAAMNVQDVDAIMPPPEKPHPADAMTENMNMLGGKGAIATLDQNHDAHIPSHTAFSQQAIQMQNIAAYIMALSHTQVHKALRILQQWSQNPQSLMHDQELQQLQQKLMQQAQQWMENPQILLTIPQIQKMIDQQDADEDRKKQEEAQQQAQNQPQPIDPALVGLEEIKQRRESEQLKMQEIQFKAEMELKINEAKIQAEREKNEMRLQSEREKREHERFLAEEKQKFDLLLEQMRSEERQFKTNVLNQSNEVHQ